MDPMEIWREDYRQEVEDELEGMRAEESKGPLSSAEPGPQRPVMDEARLRALIVSLEGLRAKICRLAAGSKPTS